MANHNAKGRKSLYDEKAKMTSFRLYSWEKEPVRDFIKKLRYVNYLFEKRKGEKNEKEN